MRLKKSITAIFVGLIFLVSTLSVVQTVAGESVYLDHHLSGQVLNVDTTQGQVRITAYGADAFEVFYSKPGVKQLPSFAIGNSPLNTRVKVDESKQQVIFSTGSLKATIQKSPFRITYERGNKPLLAEEKGFFAHDALRGFRFELNDNEKLLGAGERVLGMDRRGHRLPLYNRAHYGYETESDQMYYGVPAVLSSNKYMLVFDNSASGFIDLGKSEQNILQFEAVAGRTAYLVITGETYPDILNNYVSVTGKQPLPSRWAFGNYASRFGYHSEKETRSVVEKFRQQDIPLDAVILDLYWFGANIKGHLGNLDWDKEAFPTPVKMIADFKEQGVNTVLITEPFVLTTSNRWQEAVDNSVLAKNLAGKPKRFDFYFGNTGIIDVFDENAQQWFWNIYQDLIEQGVEGLWGDLGEPEVHPADTIHAIGSADEIHNVYGHTWAEMIFKNHEKLYPDKRPMIMMRSGFAGSQRYGMIPWTGDVNRSWGGLQPQVELSLQMGLMGLGYIHSDLGGFAGGTSFDAELYTRWLQFGTFQPVFRPHGQEHIASEPVFHDDQTKGIVRDFIKLRYRMLPYNYTLAWQNSTSGIPLARPLFFLEEANTDLIDNKASFLWGDALLVSPVVEAGVKSQTITLPKGIWFDFWNDRKYRGGKDVVVPVSINTIPVLVRAGSFIPMLSDDIATTRDYSSERLTLHYYADNSVKSANGVMYEDDGQLHRAHDRNQFEVLEFSASQKENRLKLNFSRNGGDYKGKPDSRELNMIIHHWKRSPQHVIVDGHSLPNGKIKFWESFDRLELSFTWSGNTAQVDIH